MPKDLPAGYADNYRERDRARRYLAKYETQWTKRLSTRREMKLIRRLLREASAQAGPLDTMLDLPCGPGRLLSAYAPVPKELLTADVSPAMAALARQNAPPVRDLVLRGAAVDGLSLPFPDRSFDCVLSIRLAHHLRGEEMFRRYMAQILRVSGKAVLFTFFSSRSVKNRLRGASVAAGRRSPKNAVDPDRVREWADETGFRVAASLPLSRLASGHLYTLLVRKDAAGWDLSSGTPVGRDANVLRLAAAPGRPYGAYAKRYPAWSLRLGRRGRDRAIGEWERLLDLRAAGGAVARPLAAWGEAGGAGVGVTEEVPDAVSLRDLVRSCRGDPSAISGQAACVAPAGIGRIKEAFSAALKEIAILHTQGWILMDAFAKNVLVSSEGRITLIDLPRAARIGGAAPNVAQVWDLANLYRGVRPVLDGAALRTALGPYLALLNPSPPSGGEGGVRGDAPDVEALAARVEGALRLKESGINRALVGFKRVVRRSIRAVSGRSSSSAQADQT